MLTHYPYAVIEVSENMTTIPSARVPLMLRVCPCRAENEARRPDCRVQSDVWDVQVPAYRHELRRPVGLDQSQRAGPDTGAVRA